MNNVRGKFKGRLLRRRVKYVKALEEIGV